MDAVSPHCQRHIGSAVDQESCSLFSVRRSSFLVFQDANCIAREFFECSGGKIFFAELNVIDADSGGFGDFLEQTSAARGLVTWELGSVSDVVKERAVHGRSKRTTVRSFDGGQLLRQI